MNLEMPGIHKMTVNHDHGMALVMKLVLARMKEEEEEEEESLFKADAVNEEDPERDRAIQV